MKADYSRCYRLSKRLPDKAGEGGIVSPKAPQAQHVYCMLTLTLPLYCTTSVVAQSYALRIFVGGTYSNTTTIQTTKFVLV